MIAAELAALEGGNGMSRDHLFRRLVSVFARTAPGCVGASITIRDDDSTASAESHADLERLHASSRRHGQDPELAALEQGGVVTIDDTFTDTAWPDFCLAAAGHGIRSVLISPLATGHAPTVLGLYGVRPMITGQVGLTSAICQAQELLRAAERQDELLTTVTALTATQVSRGLIDQAIGIVMGARQCAREAAFAQLCEMSNHANTKLADVARQLVGDWPGESAHHKPAGPSQRSPSARS